MNTVDLTVSRTISARAEDVFDVWMDPTVPVAHGLAQTEKL